MPSFLEKRSKKLLPDACTGIFHGVNIQASTSE